MSLAPAALDKQAKAAILATNQAFWNTLKSTLPPSAKIDGVTVDRTGVTVKEISHGLTHEGMQKAIKAMYDTRNAAFNQMIVDFKRRFLGDYSD